MRLHTVNSKHLPLKFNLTKFEGISVSRKSKKTCNYFEAILLNTGRKLQKMSISVWIPTKKVNLQF